MTMWLTTFTSLRIPRSMTTSAIFMALTLLSAPTLVKADVRVELEMDRFAPRGGSVTLQCVHNVVPELLYKVEWLREASKFFQYVKERSPPFRNFTIVGAEIDWDNSNEQQITLRNLELAASGVYSCEVTLETPIYTKASSDRDFTVIMPQEFPPKITFGSPEYHVGETLVANCTTSPARPPPHITWLINGMKVNESMVYSFPHRYASHHRVAHLKDRLQQHVPQYDYARQYGYYRQGMDVDTTQNYYNGPYSGGEATGKYRSFGPDTPYYRQNHTPQYYSDKDKSSDTDSFASDRLGLSATTQLKISVSELHAGTRGKLELTCRASIPAYVDTGEQYADVKVQTVTVDIEPEPSTHASVSYAGKADTVSAWCQLLYVSIIAQVLAK